MFDHLNNGKFFREFTARELYTEYIFSLMKEKKEFMVFPDNKQVLIEEEMEEWIDTHDFLDPTPRLFYKKFCDGYIVRYANAITNVFVPEWELQGNYEEFIKQTEEDMGWRIE